jgi:hypothetical protein
MTAQRVIRPAAQASGRFVSPALFVFRSVALGVLALVSGGTALFGAVLPDARSVSLPVEINGSSVSVRIPAGAASCLLEVKLPNTQRWYRWKTLLPAGKPALSTVPISKSHTGAEWRATANVSAEKAALFAKTHKFPDAYYQGPARFTRTPAAGHASGYVGSVPVASQLPGTTSIRQVADRLLANPVTVTALNNVANATHKTAAAPVTQAVEADIWKAQGQTVFFFNQLRGLQVIDLADPAAPRMQASLRLPAVGQDLYVLPAEDPAEALVVLLARSTQESNAATEVLTVRTGGSKAEVVSRTPLEGWLVDSRMVGNRLYILTSDSSGNGASTALQEIEFLSDGTQSTGRSFALASSSGGGLISAGADWLAVSSNKWEEWPRSSVTFFGLNETGAELLTPSAIRCAGQIYDKFKVSYQNNTLTVVSQRFDLPADGAWWRSEPVTLVENFDSRGAALCKPLEVIRGEQLYATRFLPGKLYVVTAVQDDPLWVIDLKDPARPVVTGHVEVPGFSTYIEPVGEDGRFLFTIGLEAGRVAASLFDVSEVSKPELKSRVYVSEAGTGFSEAVYDEKALKVLSEDGLVLIPFAGWRQGVQDGEKSSFVRLLDMSLLDGGSLTLRGRLDHAFAPRRAMLLDGVLTSISQKELVTADIADRDHPSVLAEVGLAWPVNQVLRQDQYLLQIGDGANAGWTGESAALRVTRADALDTPLADIDLGEGSVQDATLKGGRLYVLRKKWGAPNEPLPYAIAGSAVVARKASASELLLDVYDASALPALPLLGSAVSKADAGTVTSKIGTLLWISDTIVGVVSQPQVWSYGWEPRILEGHDVLYAVRSALAGTASPAAAVVGLAKMVSVDALPYFPRPRSERLRPAVVRAFDVSVPTAPLALSPLTLTGTQSTMLTATAAGDGLLVFGYGEAPVVWNNTKWPQDREQPVNAIHRLGIADFAVPSRPVLRAPVVLPGRLFAATEVSRTGILAFTESVSAASVSESPVREVKVSAVDYPSATVFVSKKVSLEASLVAEGRALFVSDGAGAQRSVLDELGQWLDSPVLPLPFQPRDLAVREQELLGVSGDQLLRVSFGSANLGVDQWKARIWVPAARLLQGGDRSLYAPQGDYGVQLYPALSLAP